MATGDAARRRVIDLALARRPEMDLDELHRVLVSLGIEVDTDTLLADLDALGFDVDDEPTAEGGDGGDDGGLAWYAPVLLAVVAAVAVLIAAFLVLGDDGDDPLPTGGTVDAGDANLGSGSDPASAPAAPSTVAPSDLGEDPDLVEPDLAFLFDDGPPALAPLPDGGEWTVVGGEVDVVDGRAVTTTPTDGPVLATFAMDDPDARVQVTLPEASEGAGLAFRLDDDGTHFEWVATPTSSTVTLYQVTEGGRAAILDSGTIVVGPGVTLGLNMIGPGVELFANGVVVATYDQVGEGAGLGLVASSPGVPGVFDDLLVQYA